MGFKIASAYVTVEPQDEDFEGGLRRIIAEATADVTAEVGLGLHDDAPEDLRGDLDAALLLTTDGLRADVGLGLRADAVEELDADVRAGIDLVQEDAKVKVQVDANSAKDAGEGASKLIIAGIAAGAALGAPVLLAGVGAVFAAIEGYALASNVVIKGDFQQLGADASSALTRAAAPGAATLNAALLGLDQTVKGLRPDLATVFGAAMPDITALTGGVEGLVQQVLPGIGSALGSSQVIVADFANSLPPLGSGLGSFFTGLTRDSATTGAGLQSVLGVISNTVGTLGTVLGSASSAISSDLLAIDPVINGLLASLRAVANPATVGAAGGWFAAWKLDPSISSGLQSASNRMTELAAKAEGAGGLLGKFSGAAEGAAGGLGTMADVMSGPWGLAIGAGVGLLSGLAGSLIQAAHASDALTLSQEGLAQAVAQDGGQAGQATAAYIAQQDAANGLTASALAAGVGLDTWTQAVLGNKSAQIEVTAASDKLAAAQQRQADTTDQVTTATGKYSQEQQEANHFAAAAPYDQAVAKQQQLLASMAAQSAQITKQITQQTQLQQATNALNNSAEIFNATLDLGYQKLVGTAQQTAMSAVAALNLGSGQAQLNTQLYDSVTAYSQATAQASGYAAVLQATNGNIAGLLGAEAAFTTSLAGLTSAVDANGKSLNVSNTAGALNITTIEGIATSADKAAQAVYQNEVATKGANVAWDDANQKLSQERDAFIAAADKAHLNKTEVQQLADELFKLPADTKADTTTNAPTTTLAAKALQLQLARIPLVTRADIDSNAGSALSQVEALNRALGSLNGQTGNPNFTLTPTKKAFGGDVVGGRPYTVGDGGRAEVFVPDRPGRIVPSVEQYQRDGGAVGGAQVTFQYFGSHLPTAEQRAQQMRDLASVGVI